MQTAPGPRPGQAIASPRTPGANAAGGFFDVLGNIGLLGNIRLGKYMPGKRVVLMVRFLANMPVTRGALRCFTALEASPRGDVRSHF